MIDKPRTWWKDGTVYQVYPASFKDSNGDGLGDLPGITSKLDYLKDLGVDIVWVSPMYDSPQIDMGYDIRNYEKVYEPYGTVKDMETLIQKAHEKEMRVIMDLVINHTSDQHAWFQESRASKDNPKRDWYIWRPAKYDKDGKRMPPNNWRSAFSKPAWEWDENTQEYYLHLFATEQPDLNWENEETRRAIYATSMTFWLERGVDGFRVDTVNMYSKGEMADASIVDANNYYQPFGGVVCNGPRMHEFLREMNTQVLNKYDTMTVGELPWTPEPAGVLRYVGQGDKQLSMCFQFDLCDLGNGTDVKYNAVPWTIKQVKEILNKWQNFHRGTDGWTTAFLENHDQGRSVSRYATDEPKYRVKAAKMLAIMLTTMTGTVFIYQGQEIGMINAPRDWPISKYKDIESTNHYRMIAERTGNDPVALEKAMSALQIMARDHARLPMQWTDEAPYAGFSDPPASGAAIAEPWMSINPSYKTINVQSSLQDPTSVLNFYKRLLKFRKSKADLIIHGSFDIWPSPSGVSLEEDRVLAYSKSELDSDGSESSSGKEKLVVALNFSGEKGKFEVPEGLRSERGWNWKAVFGNYEDDKDGEDEASMGKDGELRAWEGRAWILTKT